MAITLEQAAAHEAGHAVLGLAMGAKLLDITMIVGKDPKALLPGSPDATLATSFVPTSTTHIEARRTYLIAVGGMAGEIVFEGAFHTDGAADDLARLKSVNLGDEQ